MRIELSKNLIRIEHETFTFNTFNDLVKIFIDYSLDIESSKILLQLYAILLQNYYKTNITIYFQS